MSTEYPTPNPEKIKIGSLERILILNDLLLVYVEWFNSLDTKIKTPEEKDTALSIIRSIKKTALSIKTLNQITFGQNTPEPNLIHLLRFLEEFCG